MSSRSCSRSASGPTRWCWRLPRISRKVTWPACTSLAVLRNMGFTVAIDDLGEGFASLKLWSENASEYVKVDKHFVQQLHRDSFKLQFVRAIHEISTFSGASVIAEGIETAEELRVD